MKRVASNYERPLVEASKAGLLELAVSLRSYREAMVLVGGWVPYFIIKGHSKDFQHVGSIDIDIVIDPSAISEAEYASIVDIIKGRGWVAWEKNLFSYVKPITSTVDGKTYEIRVDFLTTEPEKFASKHRHAMVQHDMKARMAEGAKIALQHRMKLHLEGQLPDDGEAQADIWMLDIVGCVGMKGLALGSRYSEKDAYDLFTVLDHHRDGPKGVAQQVWPFKDEPLMNDSLVHIREMFKNERAAGPAWVANFITDLRDESHKRQVVRAYMVVTEFLRFIERN
jgi:hypothetical protein